MAIVRKQCLTFVFTTTYYYFQRFLHFFVFVRIVYQNKLTHFDTHQCFSSTHTHKSFFRVYLLFLCITIFENCSICRFQHVACNAVQCRHAQMPKFHLCPCVHVSVSFNKYPLCRFVRVCRYDLNVVTKLCTMLVSIVLCRETQQSMGKTSTHHHLSSYHHHHHHHLSSHHHHLLCLHLHHLLFHHHLPHHHRRHLRLQAHLLQCLAASLET